MTVWYVDFTADPDAGECPTAWAHTTSEQAAQELVNAVQSIDGSMLERDGTLVYAALEDPERARQELEGQGFQVLEAV